MLHGDISNQVGLTLAFKCEDFLIKYRSDGKLDKFLNAIVGKNRRAYVDETVSSALEHIYRQTPYTVDVVVESANYEQLKPLLDDLMFNRIVLCDKASQITARLNTGDLSYYVDDNEQRRSLVNSQYAISFKEFTILFKRGRVR